MTGFRAATCAPSASTRRCFPATRCNCPPNSAGPGPIRLVHFWDPACPCNVGNQQHLGELIEHYAPQGVEFYALQKPGSHGQLPDNLRSMKTLTALPGADQVPASPAVAIWDRSGKLAYFGPYSEGLTCNSSNSFIEPILQALQRRARGECHAHLGGGLLLFVAGQRSRLGHS